MNSPSVVILGLNISGLGVMQSLGERGVSLLGIDHDKAEIGFYSRYGEKIVCEDNALINYLVALGKIGNKKRIIIPTSDEYLLLISRAEDALLENYYLPFPRNIIFEQILDKYKFYLLASQFTEDIPVCSLLSKESCSSWQLWPAIVKPIFIHEFKKFYPNIKAWVVQNKEELAEKYTKLNKNNLHAIVQEIIPSKDSEQYSVSAYLDAESNAKKFMVARKTRQNPPGYGVGTYVEMIDNEDLAFQTCELLKKIKFVGIAEVEYRRDERDGKLKIIEINSRVWTQNKLASYGGVDIIGAAYSDLLNEQLQSLKVISKRWVFFARDLITCFLYLRKKEITFNDITATYLSSVKNIGAIWNKKDIRPAMLIPLYLYRKNKLRNKKQ
jgi:D-aspartate ligase